MASPKIPKLKSKFEEKVYRLIEGGGYAPNYEPIKLAYIVPEKHSNYSPDWVVDLKNPKRKKKVTLEEILKNPRNFLIIETKGLFKYEDRVKMQLIRNTYPTLQILLWFMRDNWISKTKKTKYSDWAVANGFFSFVSTTGFPDLQKLSCYP